MLIFHIDSQTKIYLSANIKINDWKKEKWPVITGHRPLFAVLGYNFESIRAITFKTIYCRLASS